MKVIKSKVALGVALLALLVVAAVAVAGSWYGVNYNSQAPFKISTYNVQGSANFNGTAQTSNLAPQVRLLKNGSQVGQVTTYGELAQGSYYNFNGYASYPCSGLGLSTFVVQSRLVKRTPSGPIVSGWDSGPGKNIYCN